MTYDLIVVGTGMGSLSAAALLAKKGLKILILEQNWLPGGCTSSYWRKGFIFESGATTLVGMDEGMPLRYVTDRTGIEIPMRKLDLPMQVHMADGKILNKYSDLERWIEEAENYFGKGQAPFWRKAYDLSRFVWEASTRYRTFPPVKARDFLELVRNFSVGDVPRALNAFQSTEKEIEKAGIMSPQFRAYVNEQLLITAQNYMEEVNFLFGAASLCYTNYGNYYVDGGLINLVRPFTDYIEKNHGEIQYRNPVKEITRENGHYLVQTKKGSYKSRYLISGIPINNTLDIYEKARSGIGKDRILDSGKVNSAFQMGIGFKSDKIFESLHHQIHLSTPLAETGSNSIFVSLSHPDDSSRADEAGYKVASVSTHIPDPANNIIDPPKVENAIINILQERGFLRKEDIAYMHSSSPKSWMKWTGRQWGFVGGYPQFKDVKPWQMIEARLDKTGAYQVGDTAYPGQGIPGTTLSGIVAAEKLVDDWGIS